MTDELISLTAAAIELGLRDARTIAGLLRRHGIPIVRLGRQRRVRRSDLQRLITASLEFGGDMARSKNSGSGNPGTRPKRRSGGQRKPKRRGWRQTVEQGLYRDHRVSCPASKDRRPTSATDCDCLWLCRIAQPGGRIVDVRFEAASTAEARKRVTELRNDARDRRSGESDHARLQRARTVTLSQFYRSEYKANATVSPATAAKYDSTFRAAIDPYLGAMLLKDLTPLHIRLWWADLAEADMRVRKINGYRSENWIQYRHIVLRAILMKAVELRYLDRNPAGGLKAPAPLPLQAGERQGRTSAKVFNDDQYLALLRALEPAKWQQRRHRLILRLGYEVGLRNSEVRGLLWRNIAFDEHVIHVKHQIDHTNSTLVATKGKRARDLDVNASLIDELVALRESETRQGFGRDADFVFRGAKTGRPISMECVDDMMAAVQRRAGLLDADGRPLLTFHGLRHSAATRLILAGVPLKLVSEYLGHWSVLQIEKTYWHLLKGSLRAVADTFTGLTDSLPPVGSDDLTEQPESDADDNEPPADGPGTV